ncbi:MAG: tetratricopeptide repeat protein, partial [Candidatus Hodarchaeales archaeon]
SSNQTLGKEISLNDWFNFIESFLVEKKDTPLEIWALSSKIAWIITDVSFFIDNIELIEYFRKDPLALGYFSLGLTEFIDFELGFGLLKEAFLLAESQNDWFALFDLSIPYTLILNNSDNHNLIKKVLIKIEQLHKEKLKSNPKFKYIIEIVKFFAHEKGDQKTEVDFKAIRKAVQEDNNHLYSALALTCSANKFEDKAYKDNQEEAIKELEIINAKMRLIIAITNLAYYYVSQSDFDEASRYYEKALELTNGVSKANIHGKGIYIYPLFQKAWLLVRQGRLEEAQGLLQSIKEKSISYKSPHYQGKANFGLAHVFFLQNQNEDALNHAKESVDIAKSINNPNTLNSYYLEYADLLIDLKELEEVSQVLSQVEVKMLRGCSKPYHEYLLGKFELNRFNVGTAKKHLNAALDEAVDCENLKAKILFTISEANIHEFRISEDSDILEKAQELITKGLEFVTDIPNRMKGNFLSAILLCAQGNYDEAEEMLEQLTDISSDIQIPRFRIMAEDLLDNIRDNRVGSNAASPITNVRDVLRYLRDAKTLIEFNPR